MHVVTEETKQKKKNKKNNNKGTMKRLNESTVELHVVTEERESMKRLNQMLFKISSTQEATWNIELHTHTHTMVIVGAPYLEFNANNVIYMPNLNSKCPHSL